MLKHRFYKYIEAEKAKTKPEFHKFLSVNQALAEQLFRKYLDRCNLMYGLAVLQAESEGENVEKRKREFDRIKRELLSCLDK